MPVMDVVFARNATSEKLRELYKRWWKIVEIEIAAGRFATTDALRAGRIGRKLNR